MDLNYFYHRHQVSLMRAGASASAGARLAHLAFARGYAMAIHAERALRSGGGPARLCVSAAV